MTENKNKVEALLFAAGKKLDLLDIAEMIRISVDETKEALNLLKNDYDSRSSSLMVFEEGNFWKITTKEEYSRLVQNVVVETELERGLMETLAVIAWKYPVVQSEIVKIRHNKAYEHMKQLEDMGFVIKEKFGRTYKVKLTDKFFHYFDLPDKKHAQEAFREILPAEIISEIEKKETQIAENEQLKIEMEEKKTQVEEQIKKQRDDDAQKFSSLPDELKRIESIAVIEQPQEEIPEELEEIIEKPKRRSAKIKKNTEIVEQSKSDIEEVNKNVELKENIEVENLGEQNIISEETTSSEIPEKEIVENLEEKNV